MTSLEEKVQDILDNSDFNELPEEERNRIIKYMQEQQILTLYQTLKRFQELTNATWKRKQGEWLDSCVKLYRKEYTDYDKS